MRVIISFSFLLLGLSSCANMGKNDQAALPMKGIDLDGARKEALKEKGLFVCGDWPEKNWWDDFQDCELSKVIENALRDNPSLQSVQARVMAVKGQADVVKSKLFPKVNALFNLIWIYLSKDAQKSLPRLDPNFHFYTVGFDFTYEFDFWGKNRKLFLAALGEVQTEEALLAQAKISLSTSVAIGYFNLQATAAKLQVMSELLENRSKQLELTILRDKYRIANLIDVDQMKQEVLFLQEGFSALKEELDLHKSSFLTLMGHNPAQDLEFGFKWKVNYIRLEIPKDIGLNLLARRADLAAQMARVKKSANLVGVAVSQFYPSVNLAGLLAFQDLDFNRLFSGQSFMPTLFPLIQLPIFQGGKLRANLREKLALHEAAVYDYNDSILRAANEVVKSINRLISVNEQLNFHYTKSGLSKEVSQLTDIKYKQGIDSLYKLLQAKEKYLMTKMHQIELERIKYESVILLIRALGGGYNHE